MKLKITKEKVLEAASKCSTAKETLKTLFPEVFEEDKYFDFSNLKFTGSPVNLDIRRHGEYARRGLTPKKLPKFMYHEKDHYLMELTKEGYYETQMPSTRVPKIGYKPAHKKKFKLDDLVKLGYKIYRQRKE